MRTSSQDIQSLWDEEKIIEPRCLELDTPGGHGLLRLYLANVTLTEVIGFVIPRIRAHYDIRGPMHFRLRALDAEESEAVISAGRSRRPQ